MYKTIARTFYLTIFKLSVDKKKETKEDLLSKNFSWKDSLTELDSWISFYYQYGRFPGSKTFINVPHADQPIFLRTKTFLLPPDLYKKFAGTDAKGLVSLHALAALNIYFGGNRIASQTAFGELLKNLTYQALSQENDDIFLSFEEGVNLVHSIVNAFAEMENTEFQIASQDSKQISEKLDTQFEVAEALAMQIQLGEEESVITEEPKPIEFSTPLK